MRPTAYDWGAQSDLCEIDASRAARQKFQMMAVRPFAHMTNHHKMTTSATMKSASAVAMPQNASSARPPPTAASIAEVRQCLDHLYLGLQVGSHRAALDPQRACS